MTSPKNPAASSADLPGWILLAGPQVEGALSDLASCRKRLRDSLKDDYVHEDILQAQISHQMPSWKAQGLFSEEGPAQPIGITPQVAIAWLHNYAKSYRLLCALYVVKKMTMVQLLDAAKIGYAETNLSLVLNAYRALIEHTAHLDTAINAVRLRPMPGSYQEAVDFLKEAADPLMKKTFQTRMNLEELCSGNVKALLAHRKYKYKPDENLIDRTADSIMNDIDGLDAKVSGIRGVYELLSEFVHPNVGAYLSMFKQIESFTDRDGVPWVRKIISLDAPVGTVHAMAPIFQHILIKIAECMKYAEMLLDEESEQKEKLHRITKTVVHKVLTDHKIMPDPYSFCPCGSKMKIKFCLQTK